MLNDEQIKLVVTSAMARYYAANDGKRGMTRDDVIDAVIQFGGDVNDVRAAMVEGVKRIVPDSLICMK